MARRTFRWNGQLLAAVCVLVLLAAFAPLGASAQTPVTLAGIIVDAQAAPVPGARLSLLDPRGETVATAVVADSGTFALIAPAPGNYTVVAEHQAFAVFTAAVTLPIAQPVYRVALIPLGFADRVVVTGRRTASRVAETPQRIEVVDSTDIARSVATDVTDVLKKTAGVDVIQYNGALSGVGIRGFRPQFSGINKRSLLLIDGRPSGVTNLATLPLGNVERIEVLKGAASSIYGSSAMGGVINVVTRQSRSAFTGDVRVGGGSFGTSRVSAQAGGRVLPRVDVDVTGNRVDQRHDYRMGDGHVRPATSFAALDGSLRIGVDLGQWRLDVRASSYRGRDIMTPGDLSTGVTTQGRKDLDRSGQDAHLSRAMRGHALSLTAYRSSDANRTANVATTNPLDQPFLPYLSFESELGWKGLQLRDAWTWSRFGSVVAGVDVERVTTISRSYDRAGSRVAPFSADAGKRTVGAYGEHTVRLAGGRTTIATGARVDRITTETVRTPFKDNFTPSRSTFTVANPSAGITQALPLGARAHATVGRAFVPAEPAMLTGFTTTVVAGRTQISQGNPDLRPERSTSVDAGVEWNSMSTRADVTVFRTVVTDRFISNVTISNPPAPAPLVLSVANGLDAHISGIEFDAEHRVNSRVALFTSGTHYLRRRERLASGLEQDILNVALDTVRAGIDMDVGRLSGRVSGRYVHGRRDSDFNRPGFPIIDYADFVVVDLTAAYRLTRRQTLALAVNNLFDRYYYEKLGFPLQGASFDASYRVGF